MALDESQLDHLMRVDEREQVKRDQLRKTKT